MSRKIATILSVVALASIYATANPRGDDRIARLSYIEGHVGFQHAGEVDWSAASINMALQPADRIYTGDSGRAEVQFDDGSVIRLAEKTDAEILALRENLIQVRILVGLVSLTSRSNTPFEISTPAAVFTVQEEGAYRFDVLENGDSDGIVRKGLLTAANNRFSRQVESGEVLHVTAGEQSTNELSPYDQRDAWDEWADRRDADMQAYATRRYLPDYVSVGVSDLDRYGRWIDVDTYGPAWVPSYVDAGWSPYWDGRWYYRPYWGWSWVSYEPWGWLPYHYGRWHFSSHAGWCWLPGPSFSFHFWSPGLVRFHQGPRGVSWCPLGPGDYYDVNNYFYNTAYNYQLNNLRLMQRRVPEDLANAGAPGAIKHMPVDDFVGGARIGRGQVVREGANAFRGNDGQLVTGALALQPSMRSYEPAPDRASARPAHASALPTVVRTEPSVSVPGGNRFVRLSGAETSAAPATRGGTSGERLESTPAVRSFSNSTPAVRGGTQVPGTGREGAPGSEQSPRTWNRLSSPSAAQEQQNRGFGSSSSAGRQPSAPSTTRSTDRGTINARPDSSVRTIPSAPRSIQSPAAAPQRGNEQVNPRTNRAEPSTVSPKRPTEYSSSRSYSNAAGAGAGGLRAVAPSSASSGGAYRARSYAPASTERSFSGASAVQRYQQPAARSYSSAGSAEKFQQSGSRSFSAAPSAGRAQSFAAAPSSRTMSAPASRSWGSAGGAGMRQSSPSMMRAPSGSSFGGSAGRSGAARPGGNTSRRP